jgi:hypothetical protein
MHEREEIGKTRSVRILRYKSAMKCEEREVESVGVHKMTRGRSDLTEPRLTWACV